MVVVLIKIYIMKLNKSQRLSAYMIMLAEINTKNDDLGLCNMFYRITDKYPVLKMDVALGGWNISENGSNTVMEDVMPELARIGRLYHNKTTWFKSWDEREQFLIDTIKKLS